MFDPDGLLLRVMPGKRAAESWRAKHFPRDPSSVTLKGYASVSGIRREFDLQMKLGLSAEREISDLLWYGGVSSDWKGPGRNGGNRRGIVRV